MEESKSQNLSVNLNITLAELNKQAVILYDIHNTLLKIAPYNNVGIIPPDPKADHKAESDVLVDPTITEKLKIIFNSVSSNNLILDSIVHFLNIRFKNSEIRPTEKIVYPEGYDVNLNESMSAIWQEVYATERLIVDLENLIRSISDFLGIFTEQSKDDTAAESMTFIQKIQRMNFVIDSFNQKLANCYNHLSDTV